MRDSKAAPNSTRKPQATRSVTKAPEFLQWDSVTLVVIALRLTNTPKSEYARADVRLFPPNYRRTKH